MRPTPIGRVSRHATVRWLLADDFVWDAADRVDLMMPLDPTRGGRPRGYPLVCALIWNALVTVFGSSRQVGVELDDPDAGWWTMIRDAAAARGIDVPQTPMRRHHYEWIRNRYMQSDLGLEEIRDEFNRAAAGHAVLIGLCDPDGDGSLTHPSGERVVVGDGKVITPRFKTHPNRARTVNKTTGEIHHKRADPDAGLHVTGGGVQAFGTKMVLTSTRGPGRNRRILLDVAHSPRNEAATAIESLSRVLPLLPGTQAVAYDGALRGTHLRPLIKTHGVVPISRVHSAQHGEVRDRHYGPADVIGTNRRIDIHLVAGAPHVRSLTVDGEPLVTPVRRVRTERRGSPGAYRMYNVYDVPAEHGGGQIRLRVDQTDHDIATGFNREENLRIIPPSDPDHDRLYGLRNDTESGNRLLDDSMLRERAHTVGWRRQTLDVMMWAAVRNATAVAQHCPECVGLDPPLAA